ncbi:hypothetical protein LLE49_01750 [Alicyclobacillus tolerans]|uniref:hypothetical protein n=1 Tax=Alicyclobacillus tolerans TaxID=90970 RepID=UPI001F428F8C|nr:hypothetical protein [Alicyclobacillus tolerans]MCF8563467.1 hypothetical protein [Alicyclobacillus tolerans]
MDNPTNDKKAGLYATTFLMPAGQWIIAVGAVMVAMGLTINARIASKKAKEGSPNAGTQTKRV